MIMRKRICLLTAILLISSMLSLTMLTVAVHAQLTNPNGTTWRPPSLDPNWVDPVTLKIREFKAQGLNDSQITTELKKLGMGWNSKTGATAIGIASTPQELALMPPMRDPFANSSMSPMLQDGGQYDAVMSTSTNEYTAFGNNMVPGSAYVSATSGPATRYITTHIGHGGTWVELGVQTSVYNTAKDHWIYSYAALDPINGDNFTWIQYKASWTTADAYSIVMRGTSDSEGYWYDAYVNYQWVRSGHLWYYYNEVNEANEACIWHGSGTADSVQATFNNNYLRMYDIWATWELGTFSTYYYATYPQAAYIEGGIWGVPVIFHCYTNP